MDGSELLEKKLAERVVLFPSKTPPKNTRRARYHGDIFCILFQEAFGQKYDAYETQLLENEKASRERPKSAPHQRFKKLGFLHVPNYTARDMHKTRKPFFPQLETTKPLKKLKIEEKLFRNFFEVSVSRIEPEKYKRGTLWDFLNIHSVVKYQKIEGRTLWRH